MWFLLYRSKSIFFQQVQGCWKTFWDEGDLDKVATSYSSFSTVILDSTALSSYFSKNVRWLHFYIENIVWL